MFQRAPASDDIVWSRDSPGQRAFALKVFSLQLISRFGDLFKHLWILNRHSLVDHISDSRCVI